MQKEYKIRYNWVGKVIHWELCKKLKFDHTTKWYKHKSESNLEIEIYKILWDFEIQIDYLIRVRWTHLVIVKKKKSQLNIVLCCPSRPQHENQKRVNYLDLARELKKLWIIQVTVIPVVFGALGMIPKGLVRRQEELKIGDQAETIQLQHCWE